MRKSGLINIDLYSIKAILISIKKHNKDTFVHSLRCSRIFEIVYTCYLMENNIFIDVEKFKNYFYAALLHDIGKIGISNEILNKNNTLNENEFNIIKSHVEIGLEYINKYKHKMNIHLFNAIRDSILFHHERIDGNGYKNIQNIEVWLQIVGLCDVLDALLTERAYKKAYSYDKALVMIKNNRSGVFDYNLINLLEDIEVKKQILYVINHGI